METGEVQKSIEEQLLIQNFFIKIDRLSTAVEQLCKKVGVRFLSYRIQCKQNNFASEIFQIFNAAHTLSNECLNEDSNQGCLMVYFTHNTPVEIMSNCSTLDECDLSEIRKNPNTANVYQSELVEAVRLICDFIRKIVPANKIEQIDIINILSIFED